MELRENDYALWLYNVPKLGSASAVRLTESGLDCRQIYEMNARSLPGFLKPVQIANIEKSKATWDFALESRKLEEKGIRFVSRIDGDFPEKLKCIPEPPFGLYVKGRLPDPERPSVAIVGARMCSDYGRFMARQFGRDLALAGVQVISGMARGIDGIAQGAALAAGGTSFGILGCGPDICYPEENRDIYNALLEAGGIISEFPPGMEPLANFFPMRNRIISGLSDVLLVVEARQKSGTSITVDTALEQGREVLAVPGRTTDRLSDGCNYLISQGAGIALSAKDVLDRIWVPRNKAQQDTADESSFVEEEVHELTLDEEILEIVDIIPISMSSILEELDRRGKTVSVPELMNKLMDMTGNGLILQNGAYYRKLAG